MSDINQIRRSQPHIAVNLLSPMQVEVHRKFPAHVKVSAEHERSTHWRR